MAFWDELAAHGERLAVVSPDERLTYRQLAARAEAAAARLGPDRKLVLLQGANSVDAVVTYLAALRGGHVVVLTPPGDQELSRAYDPDVVAGPGGVDVRRARSAHELHPDLALLLSTSGSTGASKLVRLSHENVQSNAEAIARFLGIRDTDRAATSLPMHYCYGLSVLNSHLLAGAAVLLSDRSVVDRCFWDTFRAEGGTTFAGVPYTFELLDRIGFEAMSLPTLRYVTQAGGRLAPEKVRRYAELGHRDGWDLVVMYGQTEATARMAYLPPQLAASRPEAVGVPIPGGSFEIDDEELVYRGPNVMLGYAEGPADLALGRTVDALRTGDLGRRADDGLYEVTGRRSRLVKLFGLRLDLDHVERLLADQGIDAVCAGDDQRLVVAVGPGEDPERVRRLVQRRTGLPPRSVRVCAVDDVPRLANGKPDHVAVGALGEAAGPADDRGAVRAVFADVLGCADVDDDDTFVSLGGDSLGYVEASVRLEDAIGALPPDWHVTPVHRLAALEPRRGLLTRVETSVLLRAVATVLIVGSHTGLFRILGGAHVLLGIAGFNFARFHLATGERRDTAGRLVASAARVAVPSVLWIGFSDIATKDDFGLANFVLLNNHLGSATWDERWHFWYIEALVQILLVGALLFSVPAVRRIERSWPFGLPMALVGLALTVRFGVIRVWGTDQPLFEPQTVVWVFLLGWAAARATSVPRRLAVSGLVVVAVPGFFGDGVRDTVVAGGLLLLLWVPSVAVVRPLNRLAGTIAAASLFIYLTQFEVWPLVLRWSSPPVATVASLAAGVALWALVRRGSAAVARRRSGREVSPDLVAAPASKARAPVPADAAR